LPLAQFGRADHSVKTNRLQCVKCGRVSQENERGWRAHITVDEDEPVEALVHCPKCDEREFDDLL
jgi:hypothetical protein